MKTIMLYGFLGKQFGKVHQYDVKNPAEAVRAMSATIKGFRTALIDGGSYRIVIGGQQDINLDDLAQPLSDRESIRIVPVVEGSGDVGKIILGAAIIYSSAGMAAPLFGAGGIAGTGFLTTMTGASLGMQIGSSLILGGIAELLFSPPDTTSNETGNREAASNTPSFVFDGAVNTVAQGHPVPVCYGRLIVGSQVISAGLSVEQFSTTPDVSETTYEVTEVLLYPVSPAHYIFTVEHAATFVSDTWVRQIVPLVDEPGFYGTQTWTNLGPDGNPNGYPVGYTVSVPNEDGAGGGVYTFPNGANYGSGFQITYRYKVVNPA